MSDKQFQVIVTSPSWSLSGANTFSANLVRGLNQRGLSSRMLLTDPQRLDQGLMPLPADLQIDTLPVCSQDPWLSRWKAVITYLEGHRPCIYIPNYDWDHSGVSPKLSSEIGIVGIVHSDEPVHYEHVARLGKYWNAIVCVSQFIEKKVITVNPAFVNKTMTISHGVAVPEVWPERIWERQEPLKIIYAGRLVQYQKRVFDLPEILQAVEALQIPVRLTIVGSGTDEQALLARSQRYVENGQMCFYGMLENTALLKIFEQQDVFLLTSEFEGLPVVLIEAMGRGCIPVVTEIASGIPEVVVDGVNGYCLPVGDIQRFADRLRILWEHREQRQRMSVAAYRTIADGGYRLAEMVKKYEALFIRVMEATYSGEFKRPHGRILPPQYLQHCVQQSWKKRLPSPVRKIGSYGKRVLRRLQDKL